METQATLSVVACVTLILDGLMKAIAARIQDYPFTSEMVVFLWERVNRVKKRFVALAALIEAGKIPRERGVNPRARKRTGVERQPGINWRKWLPMSRFAWLCWLMPSLANRFGAAQFGDQFRHLLGRAEMRVLLMATPKTARLLAPLCFMLGIEDSLLRPVCAATAPLPAPVAERVATEPDGVPLEIAGAPVPFEDRVPHAPDSLGDTGAEFFNPA